jgi:type II secretory ATPase GspE/PulE/Tfp pilus assembly ATPase PilB-like protein
MTAIVAQRVVRRIHEDCKQEYTLESSMLNDLKKSIGSLWPTGEDVKFYKGAGCIDCGNTGYQGRVGIFEVLPITEKISRLVLERAPASAINRQAIEDSMVTLKQDGYLKVLEGLTTVEEVLRVAQE